MKVGQTGSNQVQGQGVAESKRTGKAGVVADPKQSGRAAEAGNLHSSSDVKADISPQAKEFARAKAAAGDAPDVREERIAALKQRIADGKYNLKPDAIADKMVDEHLSTMDMG